MEDNMGRVPIGAFGRIIVCEVRTNSSQNRWEINRPNLLSAVNY